MKGGEIMNTNFKSQAVNIALSAALLLGTIASPVFAISPVPVSTRSPLPRAAAAACQRVVDRLNGAVARGKDMENRWDNISTRMTNVNQKIIAYLQQKNPSALSQYQSLVNTFTGSIATVKTDATNYSAALVQADNDANNGNCGTTSGTFKTEVEAAKTARTQLKTDAQTAKTNFQAIRTFLKSLKVTGSPAPTATP